MFFFLLFAALLAVVGIAAFVAAVIDLEGWSLVWFVAFVVLGLFFSSAYPETITVWSFIHSLTWIGMLTYLAYYLAAGVGVSLTKWYLDRREDADGAGTLYKKAVAQFKTTFIDTGKSDDVRFDGELLEHLTAEYGRDTASWQKVFARATVIGRALSRGSFDNGDFEKLTDTSAFTAAIVKKMSSKLDTITWWMINWPITLLCMLFEDLVVRIAKELAQLFHKWYDYVGKLAYRNVENG
jgi:hypothetical protein